MTVVSRIVHALGRLARAMGHQVPAERIAVLARDLGAFDWPNIIAALDAHRQRSTFYPQIADLLPLLRPTPAALRGQSSRVSSWARGSRFVPVVDPDVNGHPYRFHCDHVPTCTTWPQHRTICLADPAASLDALNAEWRAQQEGR